MIIEKFDDGYVMKISNDTTPPEQLKTTNRTISKPPTMPEWKQKEQEKNQNKSFLKDNRLSSNDIHDEKFSEISITSIILFLEQNLENTLQIPLENDKNRLWFPLRPINQNHKHQSAVYAYQHAAEISKGKLARLKQKETTEHKIEELYSLLRHLRTLRQNGVTTLYLRENIPFIKSIYEATLNT